MGMINLEATIVFEKSYDAIMNDDIRFIVEQGGSRSSKTYSLCQLMIIYCLQNENTFVSIVRKSFPSLRATVMRDFFEVMSDMGVYDVKQHNKTENLYKFENGSVIEFFSVDDEQKLRGRKRDIAWCNEANELNLEEFTQLNMRTTGKMIFDFNPSDNYHWLYDLISRPESILIHSTYKDNPFLEKSLVKEIENLIKTDESYYRIYALGEKGVGKSTIYTHHKLFNSMPDTKETLYGLDFGYNHPTALIECNFIDNQVYVRELLYKSGLTVSDLVDEMEMLGINKSKYLICDSARPEIIEELRRKGYSAKLAIKDVKPGIDSVKSSELFIHKESINTLKEISSYKWKTKGDIILDEPVKIYDDAMDAMRYGIHYWKMKNKKSNSKNFRIFF